MTGTIGTITELELSEKEIETTEIGIIDLIGMIGMSR